MQDISLDLVNKQAKVVAPSFVGVSTLTSPNDQQTTVSTTTTAKKSTARKSKARRFAKEPVTKMSDDVKLSVHNKISQRLQNRGGHVSNNPYDVKLFNKLDRYGVGSPESISPSYAFFPQQQGGSFDPNLFPMSPLFQNPASNGGFGSKGGFQSIAPYGMFPMSPNYAMQIYASQMGGLSPTFPPQMGYSSPEQLQGQGQGMTLNVPAYGYGMNVYSGPSTAVSSVGTAESLGFRSRQGSLVNTRSSLSRKSSLVPPQVEQPKAKVDKSVMLESVNLFTPSTDWSFANALWPSPKNTIPETPTRGNFHF